MMPRQDDGTKPVPADVRQGWRHPGIALGFVLAIAGLWVWLPPGRSAAQSVSGVQPAPATAALRLPEMDDDRDVDMVRRVLVAHPEILQDAMRALQARQGEAARRASAPLVAAHARELFAAGLPFIGNPNGHHVVAEFFDYQCIYCRRAQPALEALVKADPEMKVVYHEMPIEGAASLVASQAALLAQQQGRYVAMHDALFAQPLPLTPEGIRAAAASAGLDMKALEAGLVGQAASSSTTVPDLNLAKALGLSGTPSFALQGGGIMRGFGDSARFIAFIAQGH